MEKATENNEITQDTPSPKPLPKLTVFELEALFKQHFSIFNLDGDFYIFIAQSHYFYRIDKKLLEGFLVNNFHDYILQRRGSMSIIKNCADMLLMENWPTGYSAEKANILCTQMGYMNLNDLDHTQLFVYNPQNPAPYETYKLAANIFSTNTPGTNVPDWRTMRNTHCPCMDSFLNRITNGNSVVIDRIWEMLGYLLTPTHQKFFFLLQGAPNSGKSLLGNLISSYFPKEYIENLDIDQLGQRTASSRLINKSINISMDLPNKSLSPLAIRNIKLITGNDNITVEHSNGKYMSCNVSCRFLFATNHPLTMRGTDSAFKDRLICIPLNVSIPMQERDPNLLFALQNERNYILTKALGYYYDLRKSNFKFTGYGYPMFDPKINYLPNEAEDMDAHLCAFVDTACEFVPKESGKTFTRDLYDVYLKFCYANSYTPINDIGAFSRRLYTCYKGQIDKHKWRHGSENQNGFKGIIFKNNPLEDCYDDNYDDYEDYCSSGSPDSTQNSSTPPSGPTGPILDHKIFYV